MKNENSLISLLLSLPSSNLVLLGFSQEKLSLPVDLPFSRKCSLALEKEMETIPAARPPSVAAGAASSSSLDRFSSSPHQQHHNHPLARKAERILSRPLDLTYLPDALSSLSSVFVSSPFGGHPAAPTASSSSHSTPSSLHNTSSSFPFDENSQNGDRTDTKTSSSSFHGSSQSLLSLSSPVALASTPAALSALLYRERLRIHAECLSAFSPIRSKVHALSSRVQSLQSTFGEVSVHLRHSQHQLKPLLRQVSQLRSTYEHLQERQKLCQLLLDKLQLSPHHLKSLTATYPISTDGRSEGEGTSSSSLQVATDATYDQGKDTSSSNNLLSSSKAPQLHQQSSSSSSSSPPLPTQSVMIHIDTDFFVALQELEKVRRRALRLQAIPSESIELHLSSREEFPHSRFLSSSSSQLMAPAPSSFSSKRNSDEGRRGLSQFSSSFHPLHSTHPTDLHVINTRELADYILQETADLREMAYERLYLWVQGLFRQASGVEEEGAHGGVGGEKFLSISQNGQSIKKNEGVSLKSMKNYAVILRREERMSQSGVSHDKTSSCYSRGHEDAWLRASIQRNDNRRNNEEGERGSEESSRYDASYEVEKFSRFLSALGGMRRKSEIQVMLSHGWFLSQDGHKKSGKKEDEEKEERQGETHRVSYADQGLSAVDSSQAFIGDRKKTSSDRPGNKHSKPDEDHLPPLLFRAFLALRDRPPYLIDCIHEYLHLRSVCVYESIFGIRDNASSVRTSTVGGGGHLKKKGSSHTNSVPTSQHPHLSHGSTASSLVKSPLQQILFTKSVFRVAHHFALKWMEAEDQEEVQMRRGKSASETCRLKDGEKEADCLLDAKCNDVSHQMNTHKRRTQQDKKAGFTEKDRRREYEEETSALPLEVFLRAEPVHFIKEVLERFCRYAAVERSIVQGLLTLCSYSPSLQTPTSLSKKETGDNEGEVQARMLSCMQETDGRESMKRDQEGAYISSRSSIAPSQSQPCGPPILPGDSSSVHQPVPSLEDLSRHTTSHPSHGPYSSLTQGSYAGPLSSGDHSLGHRPMGGIEEKEYETCLRNDSAIIYSDGNRLLGEILHTSIQHFKLAVEKSFSMMILNTGRGDAGALISSLGLGGRHQQQQATVLSHYPSRSQQLHYVLGILLIVRLLDSYAQALHALLLFHPSSVSHSSSRPSQVYTCDAEGDSESITTTTVSTAGTVATERERAGVLSDNKGWRGGLDRGGGVGGAVDRRKENYEGSEENQRKESVEERFGGMPLDASSLSSSSSVSPNQGSGLLPPSALSSTADRSQTYQGMNGGGRRQGERLEDDGRTTLNEEESKQSSYPPVLQLVQYCEGLAEKGEEMFLSLWERHLIQTTTPTSSASAEACLSSLILAGHLSPPSHENPTLLNDTPSTSKSSETQQRDGLEKHGNMTIGGGSSSSRGNAVFFELIEKLQEVLEILYTPLLSRSEEKVLILLATGIASKLELDPETWRGIANQTHPYRQSKTGRGDHLELSFSCEDNDGGVWKEELSNLIQMKTKKTGQPDPGVDKHHVDGIRMYKDSTRECENGGGLQGLVRGSILFTDGRRSRITGLRGGQTLRFLAGETSNGRRSDDEKSSHNIESEELHSWVEGSIAPLLNFCRQDALRFHNPAETAVCLVNAYACAQEPLCRYKVCGSYVHLLSELVDQQITKLIEIEAEASLKSLGLFERLQVVRKAVERKSDVLTASGKKGETDGWEKSQDRKEMNGDSMEKKGGVSSTKSALQVSDKDLPESEGGKLLSVEELKKFFREFYMALYSTNALHLGYISRLMHRHLRSRAIIQVSKAVLQAYTEVYVHTIALGLATHTPEEIAVLLDV
ncbi:oligomeric complex protein cog6 [Cystoisospora suis]|uniref:Conserved oligomeric Golgi complex subunit 6 n=1 Tax=Cystoisospora suis TaxID=483139 RepID=A0A2C6KXG2_9APIC|nr:oligomeric complex protein cog6 [Cystoisospora suis]